MEGRLQPFLPSLQFKIWILSMKDWKIVIERLSLEDCYWKIVIERLSGTTWELGVGCRGEDIVWTGQRRLIIVTVVNNHHRNHHHRDDHHRNHHHHHHCHRPGGGGSNWWTSAGSDLPGGKVKSKSEKWKWTHLWSCMSWSKEWEGGSNGGWKFQGRSHRFSFLLVSPTRDQTYDKI